MTNTKESSTKKRFHLSNQLILNQYMLQLFGVKELESLANDMKDSSLEELDVDNVSRFYKHLTSRLLPNKELTADMLQRYDENIVRFTKEISEKRHNLIKWKYFQYLSLLFTEIYLDKYFNQREQLLHDLNILTHQINKDLTKKEQLPLYEESDLKKLAFWNATGSGKTLLMHINIKQYLFYFDKKYKNNKLEQIILLTPSEDLSRQHEREFVDSNMQAGLFNKEGGGVFKGQEIAILDIHKLRDEMGEKTVAIEAFEGNNLVLVDEGHRGSSGDEWKSKREQLSEKGFAFEYSATFGQAVAKKKTLIEEYSKCTLFDYSYRYFHADGYGKEYKILNLADDRDDQIRHLYLTACLVSYYQQLKIYLDNKLAYKQFLLEKPLWVFVGGSVNAVRTQNGRQVSDVTEVLIFLARFIKKESESIRNIKSLLMGKPGLLDNYGNEIFGNSFPYLVSIDKSSEEIYLDIVKVLFNSTISNTTLRVEKLKGQESELALRLGESEPFGVINVGDAAKLWTLCEAYPELFTTEREFSDSYFHKIDEKDSKINVLIGSKKFTEGWSSWRVSTMGLMNIGRSEGSQIIQLFGRGVRLKGFEFSLKRSSQLKGIIPDFHNQEFLNYIETLNIFGVRADYMQQFKDYLEEDIDTENELEEVILPVLKNYKKKKLSLKSLRLKKGMDFKKQGPKPDLQISAGPISTSKKIVLNWYPKIQFKDSNVTTAKNQQTNLEETTFEPYNVAFMDTEKLYLEMQRFKNEKSWHNLRISEEKIIELLNDKTWYVLQIPKRELAFNNFEQVGMWEEIAEVLLKKYCEKQYLNAKKTWEAPHLEYYELKEDDKNFINEYHFSLNKEAQKSLIIELKKLKSAIESNQLIDIEFGHLKAFSFEQHLYEPLISFDGKSTTIQVKPTSLNEDEYSFVQDIKKFHETNNEYFKDKELYIIRNQTRGKGIGFFEAGGFYPDFIIWIIYNGKQYLTFADPKGIRNLSITDPKLEFYSSVKDMERELKDPSVILNSYIISNTLYSDLINTGYILPKEEMEKRNILFQKEDKSTYIQKMFHDILK